MRKLYAQMVPVGSAFCQRKAIVKIHLSTPEDVLPMGPVVPVASVTTRVMRDGRIIDVEQKASHAKIVVVIPV